MIHSQSIYDPLAAAQGAAPASVTAHRTDAGSLRSDQSCAINDGESCDGSCSGPEPARARDRSAQWFLAYFRSSRAITNRWIWFVPS
jgi:hypothetical protein